MNKNILLLILFIMLVNVSFAQRFEGGVLAGFNGSQVEGDSFRGYYKPGILAGFYVQTDVAPAIFAAMEIKYSQKGARNKIKTGENVVVDPEKYIMRLGYAEVPFYMGFRTNDRGSIIAGLSVGYLMHGKEFDEYGEFVLEDQNAFNTIDLQPFLGAQFDFLDNVKVDLRFALSVLPIRGQPGEDATNYYWLNNQFNNVISLALYYRFDR